MFQELLTSKSICFNQGIICLILSNLSKFFCLKWNRLLTFFWLFLSNLIFIECGRQFSKFNFGPEKKTGIPGGNARNHP